MILLVDISEKDYLNFMLQYDNNVLDEKEPSHRAKIAIATGTPLPEEYGRLIDADKFVSEHFGEVARLVNDAPTVIEGVEE